MQALAFEILRAKELEQNTYVIHEDFDGISMDESAADISFFLSDDETCEWKCLERKGRKHSAVVEDGTLFISCEDTRKWFDQFGIHSGDETEAIEVYLPEIMYGSLNFETDMGSVEIPNGFLFENISFTGDTSDITCGSSLSGSLEVCIDGGQISLEGLNAGGDVSIDSDVSDITLNNLCVSDTVGITYDAGTTALKDVTCEDLTVSIDTGDILLQNVIAEAPFSIEGDVCSVKFEDCDAGSLDIQTDTGNITGTLLLDKVIIAQTSSGDMEVPETSVEGRCEIITDARDIKISIKQ